jgi:dTDP-4-amino-4,6-dideoxygalactose transaminase
MTEYTKAIIPVSLFGLPAEFDAILVLANRRGIQVMEDDAQCFLATWHGQGRR